MVEDGKVPAHCKGFPLKVLVLFPVILGLCAALSAVCMYATRHFVDDRTAVARQPLSVAAQLRLCDVERRDNIGTWVAPPRRLAHNMTDEELLRRASAASLVKEYPFRRLPKVAFMFLTRGPLPLAPLWERFFEGNREFYSVYVHPLPAYRGRFPPGSAFYRRQIPSQVVEWGELSMLDAERRLLANALLDVSNEWFVLLSESCIPLHNFSTVYKHLKKSRHSFVGAFDDPSSIGRGRYNPAMAPDVNSSQWRKGSQWFEVDRSLAARIVADTKFYPKFRDFCKPACYVDEHYFPTMLTADAPQLIANRSITWVDWSRGGPHPATFGKKDITETFLRGILEGQRCWYNNRPSSVCFLFARKFAPSALEPLLNFTHSLLAFR